VAGYRVFRAEEREFDRPSGGNLERGILRLSDDLTHTRSNVWRLPPGVRGRRHRELVQEELFVALEGTATLVLGEDREHVELSPGSLAVVEPGTAVQVANESGNDALVLIVGAPPVQGEAEYLPD
jgi:mannose-6-phosphate isomerase-like protein (cupin superfamily)